MTHKEPRTPDSENVRGHGGREVPTGPTVAQRGLEKYCYSHFDPTLLLSLCAPIFHFVVIQTPTEILTLVGRAYLIVSPGGYLHNDATQEPIGDFLFMPANEKQ